MSYKNVVRLIALAILVLMIFPPVGIAQDDWQYWHGYQLNAGLTDHFQLRVDGEQRLRDDFSNAYLANVQAGFLWKPWSFVDMGPFFKYERSKDSKGKHTDENRWLLEINLKAKWKNFRIKDRNRIAYRNRNTTDGWRYRNQLKLSYEIPVKKVRLEPYVSEELFFETGGPAFDQNRVSAGLTTHLNRHVAVTLYYLLRSKRSGGDWNEDHVLGTALSLTI